MYKRQVENLKGGDKAQDQHRTDGRLQHGHCDLPERLKLIGAVNARALVKLRGNGGQACGNQNHIKGDADPNIGDNPVSYTHLDVYKRQPIRSLSRSIYQINFSCHFQLSNKWFIL